MSEGRADHCVLFFKGHIYAIGGMAFAPSENNEEVQLQTL